MANLVEFARAEAPIPCQLDRRQPELALPSIAPQGVIVRRPLPLLKLMLVVAGRPAVAVRLAMI